MLARVALLGGAREGPRQQKRIRRLEGTPMSLTRRNVIVATAGLAGTGLLGHAPGLAQRATPAAFRPEPGAELSVLRWAAFIKAEQEQFLTNTQRFTDLTGVNVKVDEETWEDMRPKAAAAAKVGSGPDIVIAFYDDPFQYPDKLLDVTDLAESLGEKYGGWYPGLESYAKTRGGRYIALPLATGASELLYRESWVKDAGFSEFPKDTDGLLELCKALKARGHPAGFAHGKAVGDANNYAHWLVWSYG